MNTSAQLTARKKISLPVPIGGLINVFNNLQLKIDEATGAATALEMRLRIIAELVPEVQTELRKKTKKLFRDAELNYLIPAVLQVFQNELDHTERQKIESCRFPRNKLSHACFVEFMLAINGEAPGRLRDNRTGKGKPLQKENLLEGIRSLDTSGALEEFTKRAKEAIQIVDRKILRSLE